MANRFLELEFIAAAHCCQLFSGLKVEYAVLQIFTKDAGQREVELGFNVGQGSQDIGFRNTINVLFQMNPSVKVNFTVLDQDGSPTMASFIITDEELKLSSRRQHKNSSECWPAIDGSASKNLRRALASLILLTRFRSD